MKQHNAVYNASEAILSLSYGKDSIACLGAIEELGWPLHRIIHAEVWATDTIPADLPPMVEFKSKADAIIKERWGITVEHVCATTTYEEVFYKKFQSGKRAGQTIGFPHTMGAWCNSRLKVQALNEAKKLTYEDVFYQRFGQGKREGEIYGFPFLRGPWCNSKLKRDVLRAAERERDGRTPVWYVGIANDEPERIARLDGTNKVSPLVEIGWTEKECREWCEKNDLLSPIYTTSMRGGCWFCHNQSVDQLRLLRRDYPEYWALLLKWDADSPVTFKADGHTVRDYDRRFSLEDEGVISPNDRFSWEVLEKHQLNIFMFLDK